MFAFLRAKGVLPNLGDLGYRKTSHSNIHEMYANSGALTTAAANACFRLNAPA